MEVVHVFLLMDVFQQCRSMSEQRFVVSVTEYTPYTCTHAHTHMHARTHTHTNTHTHTLHRQPYNIHTSLHNGGLHNMQTFMCTDLFYNDVRTHNFGKRSITV